MSTPEAASARALDPALLMRLKGLHLRARTVVEGVLSGIHRSPHHGSSVEFSEHQEYSPGDELRLIDWKLYGKTDRLYVKRYEHETNLRATLLVDATRSMSYVGRDGISKWDYARTAAASLAWLLLGQGDAVGVARFGDGIDGFVPPRADRGHLNALLNELEEHIPAGCGTAAAAALALLERLPARGLVVILTDALEPVEPLARSLRLLRSRRHDVCLIQVLHQDEVDFPFEGLLRFASLEDAREFLADGREARAAYLAAFARHERELSDAALAQGIDRLRLATGEPLDRGLVRWLAARERRHSAA